MSVKFYLFTPNNTDKMPIFSLDILNTMYFIAVRKNIQEKLSK